MSSKLSFAFFGLSLSSSWGNGHATTYRALLRALSRRGHRITFFERRQPWYESNADLPAPNFCELIKYDSLVELERYRSLLATADAAVIGSCVPEGPEVIAMALEHCQGVRAFYDIDTPVTLAELARGECDYLSPELIPELDLYLSFSGGPILNLLRERYGAPRAEPLYCSVDPSLYYPQRARVEWDLGYLGTYSADRQPGLETLLLETARRLPEAAFVVAGAQYPQELSFPPNVARFVHVPPHQHRRFYCRQRYTLNLTRQHMIDAGHSPSVRLFEAAACGVPIMSDWSPGLSDLFELDREIIPVRTTNDVLATLRLSESARHGIAANARRRVLEEHSCSIRAQTLEQYVWRVGGERRPVEAPLEFGLEQTT